MSTKVRGYNVRLKLGAKYIAGATDDTFKISPELEENLIKDNEGAKTIEVVDREVEFSVTAKLHEKEVGESESHLDFTDLREAAHDGDEFAFIYGQEDSGKYIVTGNAIIADYQESTGSKEVGTVTLTLKTVGPLAFTTVV